MPGEIFDKLVRDKIPEILDGKGVSYERRTASPEEYKIALIEKLREETSEFFKAEDMEELADVLEVIRALIELPEYSEVETFRQRKFEERGGFENRLILKGQKD